MCLWLEAALTSLPDLGSKVTKKQMVAFHTDVTKAEKVDPIIEAIKEFAMLWR